jgi:hypothetical protein
MTASHIQQNNPNKRSVRFLMFDVSADGANFWFDISNVVLLVGAVLVALGTYGTIKFAGIKEKFSDERVAANEVETKRAIAESDSAKEGTAKANERIAELSTQAEQLRKDTAEAQLALEKLKSPRSLSAEQQASISGLLESFAGQQYSGMVAGSVPDARSLWITLDRVLRAANWVRRPPWGLAVGDPPAGVPVTPGDGITIFIPASEAAELAPAALAVVSALAKTGIAAIAVPDNGPQTRPKIIVIEIGTKPQ